MALTKKQVEDVCLIRGGHRCCRYLDEESDNGKTVDVCKKMTPDAALIDTDLEEHIAKAIKAGEDPKAANYAMAINCNGYLMLKSKKQGYDVK